jgi:guanylate kinase
MGTTVSHTIVELQRTYSIFLEQLTYVTPLPAALRYGARSQLPIPSQGTDSQRVCISGMSGSGKSTIGAALEMQGYRRIPNTTTRMPRPGESRNAYRFVDRQTFERSVTEQMIITPHMRNGVYHGIHRDEVTRLCTQSERVYIEKSVAGCIALTEHYPELTDALFLYLLPPSIPVLYERLHAREVSYGTQGMHESEILSRITEELDDCTLSPKVPYVYLYNNSIDSTITLINQLIATTKQ